MPWHIEPKHSSCPVSKPWAVVKDSDGKVVGCHPSKESANAQLAALNINVKSEVPMSDHPALRAEAAQARFAALATLGPSARELLPMGESKRDNVRFGSEFRTEKVTKDGRELFQLEGYASMVERGYEMWDLFGPYTETVAKSAFDETLAARPLVVFRFNHGGMPMASTQNNRLELWTDSLGLGDRAWLNPERADVQQLVHAVQDGDVTEQSFMFNIDEGTWNDDFTEYRIDRVNLDRGDVGPVTYGANPHTLVAARSGELLAAIPNLPRLAAREAYALLSARQDITDPPVTLPAGDDSGNSARPAVEGTSLRLRMAQLEVDRQHL
jgi:HK97 family phage prohead protease